MSRKFGTLNPQDPKWLTSMSERSPACFDKPAWVVYLKGVHMESLDNEPLRMSLCRGKLPDFCEGCQPAHRKAMKQAGRCKPPRQKGGAKQRAKKPAAKKRARRAPAPVPLVALNLKTWAVRVLADISEAKRLGLSQKAVRLSMASGKPAKGWLFKTAKAFMSTQAAVASVPGGASAMGAMAAMAQTVTDRQQLLDLGFEQMDG